MNTIHIASIIFILLLLLLLFIVLFLYYKYNSKITERFTDDSYSIDREIIKIYQEILQRDPSMDELKKVRNDINRNKLNLTTLRQLLMDSDEYHRLVKLQTNTVAPELLKTISDTDQLNRISQIYKQTLNREINSALVLPYHDLLVYVFKNNDQEFINMLLDDRYGDFENEVLHIDALDRDKLFALYNRIYGLRETKVSSWMDDLILKPLADKNKFQDAQGQEIWYESLPSAPAPKSDYLVSPDSYVSSAGYWEQNYENLGKQMGVPWKSTKQEEVSYHDFTPAGTTPIVREPVEVTPPVYPSSIPSQAITASSSPPPIPQLPLQDQPVFSSLATNSIQAMSTPLPPPPPPPTPPSPPTPPPAPSAPTPPPPASSYGASVPSFSNTDQTSQLTELSMSALNVPTVMRAETIGQLILPPQAASRAHERVEERTEQRKEPPGQQRKEESRVEPPGQQKKEESRVEPPGQQKKEESRVEPPGQQKKEETRVEPPGQQKKEETRVEPPGQQKKEETRVEPPGQQKKEESRVEPSGQQTKQASSSPAVDSSQASKTTQQSSTKTKDNKK